MTGERHTQIRRCEWCGDVLFGEAASLKSNIEFTVLCERCLAWCRKGNTIVVTRMRGVNVGKG